MIGEVIGNLNQVLDTVNTHSDQLGGLITTLQQFVTGSPRTANLSATRFPL
ncbi:hypothetical protein [Kibdelosporangium philippinense]|uniref:hypothetical protein n=1 Tax=Kibdelosporangium philippinense TaxID=211113 RepID=UPI00361C5A06